MKREIKIIMSYDDEDVDDCDETTPIFTSGIVIELNGTPVGCVQEIKLHAAMENHLPVIEIVFPNLEDRNIDSSYRVTTYPNFATEVAENIKRLRNIPNVKVTVKNIDDGISNCIMLDELGTNGHIDIVPMTRRNK